MFLLLSRVLMWLLIGLVAFTLFKQIYPGINFIGKFALGLVIFILALAFLNPTEPAVASLWRFISFPLKPLGGASLMLFIAARNLKDGGIEKPGGNLLAAALTIIVLSSTPAIAYFLVRSPIATIVPPPTLVAVAPSTTNANAISDMMPNAILPRGDIKIPSYLLQNPQAISNRGLRVEDFVPNAETLQLTTQVWESYLNQIYIFLRGRT